MYIIDFFVSKYFLGFYLAKMWIELALVDISRPSEIEISYLFLHKYPKKYVFPTTIPQERINFAETSEEINYNNKFIISSRNKTVISTVENERETSSKYARQYSKTAAF